MSEAGSAQEVLVFIPAYNDSESAAAIAREVMAQGPAYRILVIDDGSAIPLDVSTLPDGCLAVRLPSNFGLGVCTNVAFDHALRHAYKAVVRIDSDGQHPATSIADIVTPILEGVAEVTIGCRTNQRHRGVRGVFSRIVKGYFSAVSKIMTRGKSPRDVNSGYLGFSRQAAQSINRFDLERYPEPQISLLACRLGLSLREITVRQADRRSGRSSINLVRALQIFYRFHIFVLGEILQERRK